MATYNNYTIVAGENLYVYPADEANDITVLSGGHLFVSGAGGEVNVAVVSGGAVASSWNNGALIDTTVESGGALYAGTYGTASDTTVKTGARVLGFRYVGAEDQTLELLSGNEVQCEFSSAVVSSTWRGYVGGDGHVIAITVRAGGDLYVYGSADDTVVESLGQLFVSGAGEAVNTVISGGAVASSWNNGALIDTTVESGGALYAAANGKASNTTVKTGARVLGFRYVGAEDQTLELLSDNEVQCEFSSAVVSSTWRGNVGGDGHVTAIKVERGGDLYVYGSADDTVVESLGQLFVSGAGEATNTLISKGAVASSWNNGALIDTTVESDGALYAAANGTASNTTVKNGARVLGFRYVGAEDQTLARLYDNEVQCEFSSAVVSSTWRGYVGGEGHVTAITVKKGGELYVYGSADDTVVESLGQIFVSGAGKANNTLISKGAVASSWNNGALIDTTVESDGALYAGANGTASNTTVKNGARVLGFRYVGAVDQTLALLSDNEVECEFSSAVVSSTWRGNVGNEGHVTAITVKKGGELYVYGSADATVVESQGKIFVSGGGEANNTLISKGAVASSWNGGTLKNTTIQSGGALYVGTYGSAADTTILQGGALYINNKHLGGMQIATGAVVSAAKNSLIVFDLEHRAATDTALVNDLSLIQGAPSYSITVADTQSGGVYALAEGAAGFDKTVSIRNTAGAGGNLDVGESITVGDLTCALNLDSGLLTLTVTGGSIETAVRGDLNGDGRADIVMTIDQSTHPADGSTGAWLIQSDQTAAWGDLSQRNSGWSIFGIGVTTAGKTTCDVYVKSADNVIGAWVTNDAGAVTGWETVGQFDATTQVLGLGDFNGDGQTDLLLRNTNGAVGCYFTSGDKLGWNYFQSLGDEWTVSAVGDLNGDGRDDVVLKHEAGFAGSWLTQSDYTMSWADLDTLPAGFEIVGCGDFDGDGVDDVLLRNMNYYGAWIVEDGSVSSWMGLGDLGSIAVEQIADFDGDGIDDLRIRTAAGDLGTQLVKGADTLEWKYYGSVGPEWSTSLAAI